MSKEVNLKVEIVNGETIGSVSIGTVGTMGKITDKLKELEDMLNSILAEFPGSTYGEKEDKVIPADAKEIEEMSIEDKYYACLFGHYEGFVKDGVTYWLD